MTSGLSVIESRRQDSRLRVLTLLAFGAIYFLWGSTFYAIRVAVAEIPPLAAAGVRFTAAGVVLFLWARVRRSPMPTGRQWRNTAILAVFLFLIDYALLFWAEERIASGIASVLVAIIPIWTSAFEVLVFKRETWNPRSALAIAGGLGGVILLTSSSAQSTGALLPSIGILIASVSWAFGTGLSKSLQLPESKPQSAGMQMMLGGLMLLLVSWTLGERVSLSRVYADGVVALLYLTVAGSIVAFTAYVWLLSRFPASKVASYAYINPVVALFVGSWLGKEVVTWKTFAAAALILASVATILKTNEARH